MDEIDAGLCDERDCVGQPIFHISAKREFLVGWNRQKPAIVIEGPRRVGKARRCDDFAMSGRSQKGACFGRCDGNR